MVKYSFEILSVQRALGSLIMVCALAFLLLSWHVPIVHASTKTVESAGDGPATPAHCPGATCTLRDALAAAFPSDTIDFSLTLPATISLTSGELEITKSLTIDGPGSNLLSIDANNSSRIINVNLSASVVISGTTIRNGTASNGAGIMNSNGTFTLVNSQVRSNTASGGGGGIYNNATMTVTNTSVYSNSSPTAGGIYNLGVLTLNDSLVYGSLAGQGILNTGMLTITNSTVRDNAASGINNTFGSVTVSNSTISSNAGNGIANSGTLTITNSTISGNHTSGNGGGILTAFTSTVSLNNVTIAKNSADSGGGGIVANQSPAVVNFKNTLIAGNTAPFLGADCHVFGGGMLNSLDYNLIQDTTSCTISGTVAHNVTGSDPKLAPLGDYGGSTMTHALYVGSPAIDAGNPGSPAVVPDACAVRDQRGVTRPIGACDIGAFEGVEYPLYLPLILK
jgi:hypothetical protein